MGGVQAGVTLPLIVRDEVLHEHRYKFRLMETLGFKGEEIAAADT